MQRYKGVYLKYQYAGASPLSSGDPSPSFIVIYNYICICTYMLCMYTLYICTYTYIYTYVYVYIKYILLYNIIYMYIVYVYIYNIFFYTILEWISYTTLYDCLRTNWLVKKKFRCQLDRFMAYIWVATGTWM